MNYDSRSSGSVAIDFPLIDLPPQVVQPPPGSIMLRIPALPKTPPSLKRVRVENPLVNPEDSPTKKKKGHIRFRTPWLFLLCWSSIRLWFSMYTIASNWWSLSRSFPSFLSVSTAYYYIAPFVSWSELCAYAIEKKDGGVLNVLSDRSTAASKRDNETFFRKILFLHMSFGRWLSRQAWSYGVDWQIYSRLFQKWNLKKDIPINS